MPTIKAIKLLSEKKENASRRIFQQIQELATGQMIALEASEYHLFGNDSPREKYYIAGCDSEFGDELSGITYLNKNLAIYLKEQQDITIDGKGATLLIHGEMTPIVIDNCKNITIKNLAIDYVRPTVSEMRVTEATEKYFVARINMDCPFTIKDEALYWEGDSFTEVANYAIFLDEETGKLHPFDYAFDDLRAEAMGNNLVKFHYPLVAKKIKELPKNIINTAIRQYDEKAPLKVGNIVQVKYDLKTQAGAFITNSENVIFENVDMHFMHGQGIVCQRVKNFTAKNVNFAPRKVKTGRIISGFSGFFDFVGASGKVKIIDCSFKGCFDTAIKVRGTYLRVATMISENVLIVQFQGEKSIGFNPFWRHDRIAFLNPFTMERVALGVVEEAKMINSRLVEITLFDSIPKEVKRGTYMQNITAEPEVDIKNSTFSQVGSHCIFVGSSKKTHVAGNQFRNCNGAAIIANPTLNDECDSGALGALVVEKNSIEGCLGGAIIAHPDPWYKFSRVHKNIEFLLNEVKVSGSNAVNISNTDNISIKNNIFTGTTKQEALFKFFACTGVRVGKNVVRTGGARVSKRFCKNVEIELGE